MEDPALERLVALVRRDIGADDVRVMANPPDHVANALVAKLPDGRHLVATFVEVPAEHAALARRLDMLATSFSSSFDEADAPHLRLSPEAGLREELRALAQRAQALDALVIDAHSPVVWGSAIARPRRVPARDVLAEVSQQKLVDVPDLADEASSPSLFDEHDERDARDARDALASSNDAHDARVLALSDSAAARVRTQAVVHDVKRGKHLRDVEATSTNGHYAVSFAGIYVLVIVYDAIFDELRAERAAQEALPRIERLVEALPPLDPEPQPMGGVVAFRRPKR